MPKTRISTETKEVKTAVDHEVKVLRAKEWQDVFFIDLEVNGVSIYGCRFLKNKNDKWFVAFPARKDGDKYWHHVFVALSDKDIDTIDKQIDDLLDQQ